MEHDLVTLTESQKKARRSRSVAIAHGSVRHGGRSSTPRRSSSSGTAFSAEPCERHGGRHRHHGSRQAQGELAVAGGCLAFVGGMVGMAYAAVPLYAMFCQMTGYGGTTQRVEQYSDRVLDRTITVRFDANVSGGLPWQFEPAARDLTMRIGETAEARYVATNLFDRPASGRATFNVTPEMAGAYFNKVECFCFTDTTLEPGEALDMPVVFYVDPDIADVPELESLKTITLSYTFFPIDGERPLAAAPDRAGNGSSRDRREARGLTWQKRTPNRNTTTTSSIRARGRSSARSAPS